MYNNIGDSQNLSLIDNFLIIEQFHFQKEGWVRFARRCKYVG